MGNPWEEIDLNDYENHMSLDSVFQLQTLNEMMKEQFYTHPVKSVMILGIAGGNGLEHIDKQIFEAVYGVDINEAYLTACKNRYPKLQGILDTICADLTQETVQLPYADLLVANLFIEYISYECFQKAVAQIKPKFVSCIIQVNTDASFVSDSPYLHVFDKLDEVHHQVEEKELVNALGEIGYHKKLQLEKELPNGKKLVRIDFTYILEKFDYIENNLSYETYYNLRESVGWTNFSKQQAQEAMRHTYYSVVAMQEKEAVGMARLIGDGMYFMIADVIVKPKYQGMGIGTAMIKRLLEYVKQNTPMSGRTSVLLIAEPGKEAFYERFGFKKIPHEFCGAGMRRVIYKE